MLYYKPVAITVERNQQTNSQYRYCSCCSYHHL